MPEKTKKIIIKKEFSKILTIEDAIIMKNILLKNIQLFDKIILDFSNTKICPNFFSSLLTELMMKENRMNLYNKLIFINVSNLNDLNRVYKGTSNNE